jgi:four helix bundle protein
MGRDYRKIKAWKLIDELVVSVYRETSYFPKSELYGSTSQMRRAAVSAAANIVEGALRKTKLDYLHFLYIARGSLAEVWYYIHLSKRLGYIDERKRLKLYELQQEAASTLYGLIKSVQKET